MTKPLIFTTNRIKDSKRKIVKAMANSAIIRIKDRLTKRGEDADGKPMGPYDKRYAAFKKAAGKETRFVNLQFNGRMIANLKPISQTLDGSSITIGFSSAEENAKASKNTDRFGTWLGLTDEEFIAIRKVALDGLSDVIRDANKTHII